MLYYPLRPHVYESEKILLKHEDIFFKNSDGVNLHGWYFFGKAPKIAATLIFFHGNGENLSTHFRTLSWLLEYEYDYFIFDYQGYGWSEGEPSPEGTVLDGKAAVKYVQEKFPGRPIIFFGQSLGGAVAMKVAEEVKDLKLVVVESTFASYKKAARSIMSQHPLTWVLKPLTYLVLSDAAAPGEKISEISPVPLVVIHGTADSMIKIELGKEVFDLAREPKEFWEVKGGRHTDALWGHKGVYREKFLARLRAVENH